MSSEEAVEYIVQDLPEFACRWPCEGEERDRIRTYLRKRLTRDFEVGISVSDAPAPSMPTLP